MYEAVSKETNSIRMYSSLLLVLLVLSYCNCAEDGKTRIYLESYCIMKCDYNVNAKNCVITLNSSECQLKELVNITERNELTIQGKPTNMRCSRETDAGLWIESVNNLIIKDVILSGCGAGQSRQNHKNTSFLFRSAVIIESCSNVTVQDVAIVGSSGTGMMIINTDGEIHINSSRFKLNSFKNESNMDNGTITSGGGGLYIELCFCGPRPKSKLFTNFCSNVSGAISNSKYFISNTTFIKNNGGIRYDSKGPKDHKFGAGFGVGGGIAVVIGGMSRGNNFTIKSCVFSSNTALFGGGLYISILDGSTANIVGIFNSNFTANKCGSKYCAGGAVNGGFLARSNSEGRNSIKMQNCNIINNRADRGGGGSFYVIVSKIENDDLKLVNCSWKRNSARFGAAIEISPSIWASYAHSALLNVKIKDNTLVNNYVTTKMPFNRITGTILIDRVAAIFSGRTLFEENNNSALFLYSSEVKFDTGSEVLFRNNRGIQGGAIALTGYSILKFCDNSRFMFDSNSAQEGGGALFYQMGSDRDIDTSRTCFILYDGEKTLEERNSSFVFVNNTASSKGRNSFQQSHFGHSILSTTIKPCRHASQKCQAKYPNEVFDCVANFTFVNHSKYDLSTLENKVEVNSSFSFIPGQSYSLKLKTKDDYDNEVNAVFHMFFVSSTGLEPAITVASETYTSHNGIIPYGRPGEKATLVLQSLSERKISHEVNVELLECPPGHVFNEGKCICFPALTKFAIHCHDNFVTSLSYGYWMGYISNELVAKESELIISYCPFRRCFQNVYTTLPNHTNRDELDRLICGETRTGVLCSQCRPGYFMNYHSRRFTCHHSPNKCRLGWLYYILSELVPVTIFFVAVTVFDVRLTSGSTNGLILYLQLSDSILIQGNGFVKFLRRDEIGLEVYFIIIGVFNMKFFESDNLSYCLWSKAKTLDLLAIKFLTIAYALGLVVATVLSLKYCSMKTCRKLSRRLKPSHTGSNTMIHGLSSFLIVCYLETVRISLLMLTPTQLYSHGSNINANMVINSTVSSCDGDIPFFRGKHLFYAIPALLVLAVLGVAPPLLLFVYPLCYKVFGLLRISESKLVKMLCILLPLEKCKPFFDSFQSGFKDDCRFFAGLYFLYRLTALVALVLVNKSHYYYASIMAQFIVMLSLQAIFQPLKNSRHNVIDSLLFTNVILINLITALNFTSLSDNSTNSEYVEKLILVQLVLFYLPILAAAIYIIKNILGKIIFRIKKKCKDEDLMNYQLFSLLDAIESSREDNTA